MIKKRHEKYKPGDVLWVYTPLGEGFYKVWFKDRMFLEEMDYMSGSYETTYPKCADSPDCWGELETPLRNLVGKSPKLRRLDRLDRPNRKLRQHGCVWVTPRFHEKMIRALCPCAI